MALQFTMYLTVSHVHDGDTIEGELDQGLGTYKRPIGVRLAGVDAPELSTDAGKEALAAMEALVQPGDVLQVVSVAWDKYAGRIDASPVITGAGAGQDVVAAGLAAGWLRKWSGSGPRPWRSRHHDRPTNP